MNRGEDKQVLKEEGGMDHAKSLGIVRATRAGVPLRYVGPCVIGTVKEYFYPLRLFIWYLRWLKWWLGRPYRLGDPTLGKVGPERDYNRSLLWERYNAREPKRPPLI